MSTYEPSAPEPCALCFSELETARVISPGIGDICKDCEPFVRNATHALHSTKGIAKYPRPDSLENAD